MPDLSVIVPAVNTAEDLHGTLQALEAQRPDVDLEILVISRLAPSVGEDAARAFPDLILVQVSPGTTIPAMRIAGFDRATAGAIGVIEDHVIVPPGWARRMLDELEAGAEVVGGSVVNAATETTLDWAAFLCEYSHCLPPLNAGEVSWLTGNNVVYRRSLIERYRDTLDDTAWENRLHDTIREGGTPLICRPDIVVGHRKHYTFGEYLSQRYLYARSYAGARVAGASLPRRLVWGAAAALLPPLLFVRTVSRIRAKGVHRAELRRSLPLLAIFVTSWGLGEGVGYVFGPGDSLSRVC